MKGTPGAARAAQKILAGIGRALEETPSKENAEILIPAFACIIDTETAAPDLLAALKSVLARIASADKHGVGDISMDDAEVVSAQAAITKAEGPQ